MPKSRTSKEYAKYRRSVRKYAFTYRCYQQTHRNHRHALDMLIENRAPLQAINNDLETPLYIAQAYEDFKIIELLTKHQSIFSAVSSGVIEKVKDLIQTCKNPEKLKNMLSLKDQSGNTPLHIATLKQRPCIIKILVENGASLQATNNDSKTSLDIAAEYGDSEITELLK